jgi:YidC/Oxa1 family membrane protein insertase
VEKRLVLFIVLSVSVLLGYQLIMELFGPEKPPLVNNDKGPADTAPENPVADPGAPATDPRQDGADPDVPTTEPTPGTGEENPNSVTGTPPDSTDQSVDSSPVDWPDRWISRGSYNPGEGPPILVTWNARGAVVERIEITARDGNGNLRYQELLDRSGYLGHLAVTADPDGGCRINVVGEGTPADLARNQSTPIAPGLKIGDVIHRIDGESISTPAELKAFLAETKPGESIRLAVRRPSGDTSTDVELIATLDVYPLQLIQPERPFRTDESVPLHPASFLFSLIQVGEQNESVVLSRSLREDNWQLEPTTDGRGVEFRMQVNGKAANGSPIKLELVKRFRLGMPKTNDEDEPTAPYHLDYDIEIRNLSSAPLRIAYRQDGPNGLPLEGFWYSNKLHPAMFYIAGARDVVWKTETRNATEVLQSFKHDLVSCSDLNKTATKAKKKGKSPETVLFATAAGTPGKRMPLYVAVDTQYFVAAMKPTSKREMVYNQAAAYVLGNLSDIPKAARKSTNVSFHLDSQSFEIFPYDAEAEAKGEGNATFRQSFEIFAGPKVPELLAVYELGDCIYYGWFAPVSKLLAVVLHFFFSLVNNFGLAIVMLTIVVRSGMFPLSRKAAKNAAMMQVFAPQMKKIAEKYKDDMEKRNKAQQDLFKKHNYNPLGGCWMMLLQLPIFIGLYRCLSVDINLRQASLIPGIEWCSNLAGPDMLFVWPEFFTWNVFTELGMLGPYFNILPMFTVALFLVQQKLFTPPPTDDQSRMQMKMMKFMTLFIGIMFFKVAAGLCLYFIASSLWGIAERKLLPKPKLATEGGEPVLPKLNPKPNPKPKPRPKPRLRSPENGKPGRQQSRKKKKQR